MKIAWKRLVNPYASCILRDVVVQTLTPGRRGLFLHQIPGPDFSTTHSAGRLSLARGKGSLKQPVSHKPREGEAAAPKQPATSPATAEESWTQHPDLQPFTHCCRCGWSCYTSSSCCCPELRSPRRPVLPIPRAKPKCRIPKNHLHNLKVNTRARFAHIGQQWKAVKLQDRYNLFNKIRVI